jgi:carbonic anhydrase/acetyltransferase-like protein (isoleucine patch superfamily)
LLVLIQALLMIQWVHGSDWIGNNNTFFGMKSIVFNAKYGNNVAIGISSTITNGVPFMTTGL